ncbi:hypothetical protein [Agromyces humi]|uniref:hypothetical protein n=1 Tax=Agromyces humi TaxID=1766800 RepID=UPI00135B8D17|nr:hypothetical protein [Agromyces humi]
MTAQTIAPPVDEIADAEQRGAAGVLAQLRRVIAELDDARADGTVYTYGQIQAALNRIAEERPDAAAALEQYGLQVAIKELRTASRDIPGTREWAGSGNFSRPTNHAEWLRARARTREAKLAGLIEAAN